MMEISLRKNVHAVDTQNPFYVVNKGCGARSNHEVGLKVTKFHICSNVHAVEAIRPFCGIKGSGRGPITNHAVGLSFLSCLESGPRPKTTPKRWPDQAKQDVGLYFERSHDTQVEVFFLRG